jgi:hypothetical protein
MLDFLKMTAPKNANDKVVVKIRPNSIFEDAFAQIQLAKSLRVRNGINVTYEGEDGLDEGGVTRQLVLRTSFNKHLFSKEFLKPERKLLTYKGEYVNLGRSKNLDQFQFLGKVILVSLIPGYGFIPPQKQDKADSDLEHMDPILFKSFKDML